MSGLTLLHIVSAQVADAALMDVRVDGSLLVHTDCVTGSMESPHAAGTQGHSFATDIQVSHPDGRQTLYSTEPASPQLAQCNAGAPMQLHLAGAGSEAATAGHSTSSVVPFLRAGNPENQRLVFSDRCASDVPLPSPDQLGRLLFTFRTCWQECLLLACGLPWHCTHG